MSELAKIEIETDGGPWAKHNFPCPVCGKHKAVLELSVGQFHPCWECQVAGWVTMRLPSWAARWVRSWQWQ